ncbi:MAG: hypothetical protein K9K66_19345 [Desulfarculaceae bacterium]|nr:hypothetical protein [Desulfarculaceae bacterium]MCF8074539.1 hypothetical protein [Desulfarculaceae bacterium]MCF8103813.1 hypothetical protein [Desulfarculaceae bacterium]MCF8117821.1 hypothetical protein [Desulfarculaceae bacterium]
MVVILVSLASLAWAKPCYQNINNGEKVKIFDVGYSYSTACIHTSTKAMNIRCSVSGFSGKANLLVTEIYFTPNKQYEVPITENGQVVPISGQGTNQYGLIALDYYGPWRPDKPYYLTCSW